MSIAEKKKKYSVEEYLRLEEAAVEKSEFYGGEVYAMSGGTRNHSAICANIIRSAGNALMDKDCTVFDSNFKVRIEAADAFVYPDSFVICGTEEFYPKSNHVCLNPTVVFEVLSDSTADYDRGGKFRKYQQVPSLQEYVIVHQNEAQIIVYRKTDAGWSFFEGRIYSDLTSDVELKSLDITIPMEKIYYRVDFPENSKK